MDRPKEEDRELIEFKELYKSNAPMLIFYAVKYVNAIAAEDLVQDVFFKIWQKRTFLFLKEGIRTYLYRSVQHACLKLKESLSASISSPVFMVIL